MYALKISLALLAVFAELSFGAPPQDISDLSSANPAYNNTLIPGTQGWAYFCDDENCNEGCGESASVNNPGCLNESGRKSVKLNGNIAWNQFALIVSPDQNCPCQDNCFAGFSGGDNLCVSLDNYQGSSYRFITASSCPGNTC